MIQALMDWLESLFRKSHPLDVEPVDFVSSECLVLIKHYEGVSLTAYRDPVGILTIGYGDTGSHVRHGDSITMQEADDRLRRRLDGEFVPGVLAALTREPKQCELDAMVSLAYNTGTGAFAGSTLVKMYNAGAAGVADQFLRWDKAKGKSLLGLRRRRAAERMVFLGQRAADAIAIAQDSVK